MDGLRWESETILWMSLMSLVLLLQARILESFIGRSGFHRKSFYVVKPSLD
jgi:hypothetical protein